MSIHVSKCSHLGRDEYHLRYPGMSGKAAQSLADRINSGQYDKSVSEIRQDTIKAVKRLIHQWACSHGLSDLVNARTAAADISKALDEGMVP